MFAFHNTINTTKLKTAVVFFFDPAIHKRLKQDITSLLFSWWPAPKSGMGTQKVNTYCDDSFAEAQGASAAVFPFILRLVVTQCVIL